MENWAIFWACVLLGAVSLFGILAVVVAIGGVGDIKNLIAKLRMQHDKESEGPES